MITIPSPLIASARRTGSPGNSTAPTWAKEWCRSFADRKASDTSSLYKLQGLDSNSVYTLTNLDLRDAAEMTGSKLMEQGLSVSIPDRPGAVVITYKKRE